MLSSADLTAPHLNPVQAFQEGAAIGRWCQHRVVDNTAGRSARLGPVVELLPVTSCHFSGSPCAHRSVSTPLFMIGGDRELNLIPSCHIPSSQTLPTTSSRTRYVVEITLNLHPPYTNLPITGTRPLVTPNNTCTTHSSHQTGTTHASKHPPPLHLTRKHTRQIPVQHHDTPIYTRHSQTHTNSPTRFSTQKISRLISMFSRLLQNNMPNAVTGPLLS